MADLTVVKSDPLPELTVVKSEPLAGQQKPTGQTLWETLGGQTLQDLIGGASRDPKRAQKAIDTLKGLITGIADEPHRVLGQLAASGEAMTRGDVAGAASHLGGAVPFIGSGAREVQHDVEQGNYRTAAERALGLALPFATHQIGSAVSGAPEAAASAGRAIAGGARGAFDAATETVPLKRYGVDINVPVPVASGAAGAATARMVGLPGSVGGTIGAAAPIIKGAIKGARARMAQGAMEEAATAAPSAAVTPGQAFASANNMDWAKLSADDRANLEHIAASSNTAGDRFTTPNPGGAPVARPVMGPPATPAAQEATVVPSAPGRTVAQIIQDEFNARQEATEPTLASQPVQGPPEMIGAHPVKSPLGPSPIGSGPLRPPLAQMTKPQILEAAGLPKDAPPAQIQAAVEADTAERLTSPESGATVAPMTAAQIDSAIKNLLDTTPPDSPSSSAALEMLLKARREATGEPIRSPEGQAIIDRAKAGMPPAQANASTAPMETKALAAKRTLDQTNAAMAQKQPAPVDLQEAKTATNVSGDRKSPQMRGAERTAQNVDAKAQRWADALKSEGITVEDVGNMTKADLEIMRNGLVAKGKLPEGELPPNTSIDAIVKKMKESAPGRGMAAMKRHR